MRRPHGRASYTISGHSDPGGPAYTSEADPPVAEGSLLYLDPWGGVAGDMLLAALLDLDPAGRLEALLVETVGNLGLGAGVRVEEGRERGFACRRVSVEGPDSPAPRTPGELDALLAGSPLSPWVKERSRGALARLGDVEARLHGIPLEKVHFHELGAVDTLVDIAGVFALLDGLGRPTGLHGPVPLGSGSIRTEHGVMRAPAPATLELLRGRPCLAGPEEVETATPTGALLLTEIAPAASSLPAMRVQAVGYGAGHRKLEAGPNLLRAVLGEPLELQRAGIQAADAGGEDSVVLLEANIDDASGELLGRLLELLLAAGALDVWATPIQMKKGRPAVLVSALGRPQTEEALLEIFFREGTTLGVRLLPLKRRLLARESLAVEVAGEPVQVKIGRLGGEVTTLAPEYEDAAAAADRLGWPLKKVYADALEAARRLLP